MLSPLFCWTSCSCSSDVDDALEQSEAVENTIAKRLAAAIEQIAINQDGTYDEGGFVVYDAEKDEFIVCDVLSYGLGEIAAVRGGELLEEDTYIYSRSLSADPPANEGWIYAGSYTSKFTALKLANSIQKEISEGETFEIRVEPQKDGSSKVWYRIL